MVVLPSSGASRYHNCCIDGGTSPENIGYHLVNVCNHAERYEYFQYYSPCNRSFLYQIVPLKVFEICSLYAVCVSYICVTHTILVFLTSLLSRRTSFSRKLYLHYFCFTLWSSSAFSCRTLMQWFSSSRGTKTFLTVCFVRNLSYLPYFKCHLLNVDSS
jgi:hypothetical protein